MLSLVSVLLLLNGLAASAWVIPQSQNRNLMSSSALFSTQNSQAQMADFLESDPGNQVGDMPDLTEDLELVKIIAKAADGRKAEEIVGLQVAQISTLASYLVFLSGNSRPQNQAIAAAIAKDVEEGTGMRENPQGTADSGWMVLDYGSVMVHIMTPKSRLFYNVEGQWRERGGTEINLDEVLVPNKMEDVTAGGEKMEGLSEEEDPFWS